MEPRRCHGCDMRHRSLEPVASHASISATSMSERWPARTPRLPQSPQQQQQQQQQQASKQARTQASAKQHAACRVCAGGRVLGRACVRARVPHWLPRTDAPSPRMRLPPRTRREPQPPPRQPRGLCVARTDATTAAATRASTYFLHGRHDRTMIGWLLSLRCAARISTDIAVCRRRSATAPCEPAQDAAKSKYRRERVVAATARSIT